MKEKKVVDKQKRKRNIIIIVVTLLICLTALGFGLGFGVFYLPPIIEDFQNSLSACDFYQNDTNSAVAQTALYPFMYDHIFNNTSGKTPKILFIGYDGCLATGLKLRQNVEGSAAFYVGKTGTMLIGRAGGANIGDQRTETAPGWASLFTGKWANEHKVKNNGDTLSSNTRTIMYTMAENALRTSFSVSWAKHFKTTYKNEISSAKAAALPISYNLGESDSDTLSSMKSAIQNGETGVFGTLEYTDHAGHSSGYKLSNSKYVNAVNDVDSAAMQLVQAVEARADYASEDWLIVITSDHGGVFLNHGDKSPMEYTTFFVTNKPMPY